MKDANSVASFFPSQEFRVERNESHKNGLAVKYGFKARASKVELCAFFENNFFRIARVLERKKRNVHLLYVKEKSPHFAE